MAVQGEGGALPGPAIDVDPGSFSFLVEEDDTDTQQLTISNLGDEDLLWEIDTAESPASGRGVTVLLDEDFSDATFPPAGWAAFDLDGAVPAWVRNTVLDAAAFLQAEVDEPFNPIGTIEAVLEYLEDALAALDAGTS